MASVSGQAAGSTTVTATSDGDSDSSTVNVTALPPLVIQLAPATLALETGESGSVTATRAGSPEQNVSVAFSSANASVASVSPASAMTNAAGEAVASVSGEAAGSATVTATADGSSDSSTVTVTDPVVTPRTIEVSGIGGDTTNWRVSIDGAAQPVNNPQNINVQAGDIITWRVQGGFHGVGFLGQANAEALLEFESGVGLPRSTSPGGLNNQWWGTGGAGGGTLLARATVRSGVSSMTVDFTCSIHGTSDPNSGNMRGRLILP